MIAKHTLKTELLVSIELTVQPVRFQQAAPLSMSRHVPVTRWGGPKWLPIYTAIEKVTFYTIGDLVSH